MSLHDRVNALIDHLKNGTILEAVEELYNDNVSMQENSSPPTVGKAANLEREKQFLAGVKEWRGLRVTGVGVSPDATGDSGTSFIEYNFDFLNTENQPVHYEQVAVQRWENGRITHERFYHE